MNVFILVIVGLAALVLGAHWGRRSIIRAISSADDGDAHDGRSVERDENLEKARALVRARGEVTNREVEKVLGVSDATATRYMDALEADGTVRQVDAGRYTYYKRQ